MDQQHTELRPGRGAAALVLAAALLAAVVSYLAWLNFSSPTLAAVHGVIDARGISAGDGPYMLTGQWLRVPGLHTPESLGSDSGEYVEDIRYIRKMRGFTYAFSLETDDLSSLCFLLPRPHNSRLWLNGREVQGEDGAPITSVDVFQLSDYADPGRPGRADFVLQVSSSSIYDVYQGLLVGGKGLLSSTQTRWLMLDLIAVGLYLMLCVLMLALFLPKRSERYLPLLTLSALTELAHFLLITRHPMMDFFHLGTTVFYRQFNCLNYFICKLLVCEKEEAPRAFPESRCVRFFEQKFCQASRFFAEILGGFRAQTACHGEIFAKRTDARAFQKGSRWMDRVMYGSITATALGCLLFPDRAALILRISFFIYLSLQLCLLARGALRGKTGAPILLMGWAVVTGNEIFYTLLNAGLFPQGVVDVQIMPAQYARLAYVLAFAVATCQKFARKFRQADLLAADLEQQVEVQTVALRQTNAQLLELQQKRQRFMTDMVHDLRSPLFVLNGYAELLAEESENLSAEGRRYLGLIDGKLTYLGRMVDDLFLISRLEDGQIRFCFTEFDLSELLAACAQDGEGRCREKGLELVLDCPALLMTGDQFHLKQAVDNLLGNAIRHSQRGVIRLSGRKEGAFAALTVADQGDGIAPERLETLFLRYVSKGAGGSTGLGLSICKQIVERHGGSIRVESRLGEGSTFTLLLPLAPSDTHREIDKK